MAKQTGIAWTEVSLDDATATPVNITCELTDLDFSITRETDDFTGMCATAMERGLLLGDFSGTLNGKFSDELHAVLSTVGTYDDPRTLTLVFPAGSPTLTAEVLLTAYNVSRDSGGALSASSPFVLANGVMPAWS